LLSALIGAGLVIKLTVRIAMNFSMGRPSILKWCVPCGIVLFQFYVSSFAHAKCDRDEVDYYLSKGFSTDQIVVLCGDSRSAPTEQFRNDPEAKDSPAYNRVDQLFSLSIDAQRVYISDTHLHYSQVKCLEFGKKQFNSGRKAFCPTFAYAIAFKDLEILDVKRASLFSKKKLMRVKGDFSITSEEDAEFKYLKKRLVEEYVDTTQVLEIPIKAEAPEEILLRRLELMGAKSPS